MLDLVICRCPHCGKRGIGLLDKLLASTVYPAKCRLCKRNSTTRAVVIYGILGVSAVFLAIAPNLLSASAQDEAAILATILAITLKMIGPLTRYDQ